ncbi:LacI family DNA-binding transcriptional regulator [Myceligenerans indicum]|uniref:LacI family transcriptional regulator n=1 Tax=Myceligenerans indicum TaxID=2593663 RepID=A0ABS1LQX8_9MICO|nr:LacI family DNA-binding transcriptional regulator [Myceligenerans indicum]MBL0888635.1 LacI family transcriptional regulator [Myceligenerans indicum]
MSARRTVPTSYDVAKLAGVSQSTVSYVMNGKRPISQATRDRVLAAVEELTYQPNAGARALRGRKTYVIALMVHLDSGADPRDSIPYIDAVIETARSRDHDVVLITTDEGPEGLKRMAGRQNCDAFVLMDIRHDDDRIVTAATLGLPVVLVGTPADRAGLDAVDHDARRAAELMIDELADTGHEHAVLVGEPGGTIPGQFWFISAFHDGCRARAAERGLDFTVVDPARRGWTGVSAVASRLLEFRSRRLGLIARTPQVTEWLLCLAQLHSLRPGVDLSIIGMCADDVAASFDPPVSNVSPRAREVSTLAVEILFDRMDDDHREPVVHLVAPTDLTRRSTTAVFAEPSALSAR